MLKRVSRGVAQELLKLVWYTAWPISVSRWVRRTPYLTRKERLILYADCGIGLFLLAIGWFFWNSYPDQILDIVIGIAPMYYPVGGRAISFAGKIANQRTSQPPPKLLK